MKRVLIGLDMFIEMEQEMQFLKKDLKETQDRKKSYGDHHKEFKEFQIGEHVYLCIMLKRSSMRIGSCAKLPPRYRGPCDILERMDQWPIDLHCRQQGKSMMFPCFIA